MTNPHQEEYGPFTVQLGNGPSTISISNIFQVPVDMNTSFRFRLLAKRSEPVPGNFMIMEYVVHIYPSPGAGTSGNPLLLVGNTGLEVDIQGPSFGQQPQPSILVDDTGNVSVSWSQVIGGPIVDVKLWIKDFLRWG